MSVMIDHTRSTGAAMSTVMLCSMDTMVRYGATTFGVRQRMKWSPAFHPTRLGGCQ